MRTGEAGVLQGSSSWGRGGEAVSTVDITAATTVKSQSPESNHCKSSTIWIGKTGRCDEKDEQVTLREHYRSNREYSLYTKHMVKQNNMFPLRNHMAWASKAVLRWGELQLACGISFRTRQLLWGAQEVQQLQSDSKREPTSRYPAGAQRTLVLSIGQAREPAPKSPREAEGCRKKPLNSWQTDPTGQTSQMTQGGILRKVKCQARKMSGGVVVRKAPTAKADDQSSLPRTDRVETSNSHKCPSKDQDKILISSA